MVESNEASGVPSRGRLSKGLHWCRSVWRRGVRLGRDIVPGLASEVQWTIRWLDRKNYAEAALLASVGSNLTEEILCRLGALSTQQLLGAYTLDDDRMIGFAMYTLANQTIELDALFVLDGPSHNDVRRSLVDRAKTWIGVGVLDLHRVRAYLNERELAMQLFLRDEGFVCVEQHPFKSGDVYVMEYPAKS